MQEIDSPDDWIREVADRLLAIIPGPPRVYLRDTPAALSAALRRAGFAARSESGMVLSGPSARPGTPVSFRPVQSDSDWNDKLQLHMDCPTGPDGYTVPPHEWVRLERLKSETGGMRAFLVERHGVVVGAAALMRQGSILRLKNLVVARRFRRRAVATATVHLAGGLAAAEGRALGLFGIGGSVGEAAYRSAGLETVVSQTEWTRTHNAERT